MARTASEIWSSASFKPGNSGIAAHSLFSSSLSLLDLGGMPDGPENGTGGSNPPWLPCCPVRTSENAGRDLPHVHVLDAAFLKGFPGHPLRHVRRFPELFRQAHQKSLIGGFQPGLIFGTAVFAPGVEDNGPQAAGGVIVKVQGKVWPPMDCLVLNTPLSPVRERRASVGGPSSCLLRLRVFSTWSLSIPTSSPS